MISTAEPAGAGIVIEHGRVLLSRRKEEDQWRFRPNGRAGDISRLGLIDGLDGIHPVRELELRQPDVRHRAHVGLRSVRRSEPPSREMNP